MLGHRRRQWGERMGLVYLEQERFSKGRNACAAGSLVIRRFLPIEKDEGTKQHRPLGTNQLSDVVDCWRNQDPDALHLELARHSTSTTSQLCDLLQIT